MKSPLHHIRMLAALSAVVSALYSTASFACDTPVYRYAMYRWQPAPYEVYFFHKGEIPAADKKLQKQIDALGAEEKSPANIVVMPVDLQKDKELKGVPRDVREKWLAIKKPVLPSYMIVNPQGIHVHTGSLNESDLKSLVDSPARVEMNKKLESGVATVLFMLEGSDAKANARAEKEIKKVVADVASSKVELYAKPDAGPGGPLPTEDSKKKPGKEGETKPAFKNEHEVAYMTLSRTSKKDQWLVKMLLAIEPDLNDKEFKNQPMMFAVYGRARALPPYIGKGITYDNLLDCVDFVTSACSCTVKDQNPGIDLLAKYDWEKASKSVAERFGNEEGNEGSLGDLLPDFALPSEDKPAPKKESSKPAEKPKAEPSTSSSSQSSSTTTTTDSIWIESSSVLSEVEETEEAATESATDSTSEVTEEVTEQPSPRRERRLVPDFKPNPVRRGLAPRTDEKVEEQSESGDLEEGSAIEESGEKEPAEEGASVEIAESAETPKAVEAPVTGKTLVVLGSGMAVAFVFLVATTFVLLKPKKY